MSKLMAFLYGLVTYFVFFGTILYAIGFVAGLVVPKTVDTGAVGPRAPGDRRQCTADVAVRRPA